MRTVRLTKNNPNWGTTIRHNDCLVNAKFQSDENILILQEDTVNMKPTAMSLTNCIEYIIGAFFTENVPLLEINVGIVKVFQKSRDGVFEVKYSCTKRGRPHNPYNRYNVTALNWIPVTPAYEVLYL